MITTVGPFWSTLEDHGNRVALIGGGNSVTYVALAAAADEWAATARRHFAEGINAPLVMLEFHRSLPSIIAYIGCLRAGWPVIPVAEANQNAAICTTFSPNLLVTGRDAHPTPADPTPARVCDGLAVLLSTSGTTGASKLVKLSAQNLSANAASITGYLGLRPDDATITTLPLHYSYGLSVLHTHLMMGARLIVTDAALTDPGFWPLASEQGVTSLALVPTQFDLLLKTGFVETRLPTLRFMTQAGGRLDPATAQHFATRAQDHGWQFFLMYGQTEASPRMAYLPPDKALLHANKIGLAIPGGRLWLEDAEGREIDTPDTPGELVYQGPNVMIGYALTRADLAKPQETTILRTGDIAQRTRDGLYQITGRLSRFVKLNGLRIGLDEVEATLRSEGHRVRVSGDDRGIVLFTETDPGTLAAATAARYHLMSGTVRAQAMPDPPLLSSGKVDYAQLRRMAADILSKDHVPVAGSRLPATIATILRKAEIDPDLSFRQLGGNSLAFLEVELFLMKTRGRAPIGWDDMPIHMLESRLDSPGYPSAGRWQGLGSDVVIRVLATFWVVLLHTTSIGMGGGVFALSVLIGFSLARYQQSALLEGRVWKVIDTMLRPLLLTYFVLLILMAARFPIDWTWFALVANFPVSADRVPEPELFLPYWFVAGYAQVIPLVTLPFLFRPIRKFVSADLFRAGFVATVAFTLLFSVIFHNFLGARFIRLPQGMLQLVGIGWCVALARTSRQKLATLGLVAVSYLLIWHDGGLSVQEAIIATAVILLFLPRIYLPRPVARAFLELGALSMYIYLMHVPAIYLDSYFFDGQSSLFLTTAFVSTLGAIIAREILRRAEIQATALLQPVFLRRSIFPAQPAASGPMDPTRPGERHSPDDA